MKTLSALFALIVISITSVHAGIAYAPPPGGWRYIYEGQWLNPGAGSKPNSTLDLTWSGNNGSSEWAGDGRGPGNGIPGGISTNNGILTIEDINNGSGTLNNRKIYFTRDLAQDTGLTTPGTILDTGITLTFRARLSQPDIQPPAEFTVPDGWGIFSDGKGMFGVHQYNGVHSIISFSLVRASEPDNSFNFTSAGLTMNRLNGNVPTGGNAVNSTGTASQNTVVPLDPNIFHEFWITIRTNQFPGVSNGTHTVTVYMDGNVAPAAVVNVTAGTGNENTLNYLGLGLNNSGGESCMDADFYAYKQGIFTPTIPVPPPAPTNVVAVSGDTAVRLSWAAASGANSYWVLGSATSGGPYSSIANVTSTGYTNTGLVNGTTIYYVVQGTNNIGASTNSSEVVGHPGPTVAGLVATGGTGQVALAWSSLAVPTDSYNVRRSATRGGPYTTIATVPDLTYIDTAVQNGTTYYYIVDGNLTGGGTSNPSDEAPGTTAPGGAALTVSLYAETAANLSWTLSDPVVSQFLIEQSTDDGANYTQVAAISGTNRSYRAVGLASLTTYTFRIRGTNAGGLSPYSDPASLTTPAFGMHVNFAAGPGNSAGEPTAPVPAGYFQDIGQVYGDRGAGFNYGWDRNIVADGRYRRNASSPDLRYDTFMHLIKATPPAIWNIAVPNGTYDVHIVAGDPTAVNSVFQFDVEGVVTEVITPNGPTAFSNFWGDFRVGCTVTDGQLTIKSGPSSQTTTDNNKICFIDITLPTPIEIATQPQSQTLEEGRRVILSVTLSNGSPPITYQWFKDGNSIPDATNRIYRITNAQTDLHSGTYYVEITNPLGTVQSEFATVTIVPDETAPSIISANSLDGSKIKVIWNEPLDPPTGGDSSLYHVTGATITGAQLVPDDLGDNTIVILSISGLTSSTYDIGTPGGVADPFGNVQSADPITNGVVFALGSGLTDEGVVGTATDPRERGSTTIGEQRLEVVAGGTDLWGNADAFRYAYGRYTNDFDMKVRVSRLDPRDNWSKAGFDIREDLTPGAANLSAVITPHEPALDGTGGGANDFEAGVRSVAAGTTGDWGSRPTNSFPWTNAWIRVQRVGATFKAFWGSNGVTWSQFATNSTALPSGVYVGLATTAHNNGAGQTTTAVFENFGLILPPTIVDQPQTQTVNQGSPVTFTVSATGEAPFTYQWRKNGVNIPGATSDTYTINSAQPSDAANYDVIVSNVDSSTGSLVATLFVRTAPSISTHPQSQTVGCGSVTFSVSAAGSPPLTYQWRKGGMNIDGANGISYTISSVQATDAGNYSVVVSNDLGIAISDDATLTVADTNKPAITCPANIVTSCTGPSGATVNFTVTATDNCDPSPGINCIPASGATFARGTTTVNCTATDVSGNSQNCSFTVTVQDNTPAILTIVLNGNEVIITWPQSCTSFHLEEKSALEDPLWSDLGAGQAVGSNYRITRQVGPGSKFYHLKSQP